MKPRIPHQKPIALVAHPVVSVSATPEAAPSRMESQQLYLFVDGPTPPAARVPVPTGVCSITPGADRLLTPASKTPECASNARCVEPVVNSHGEPRLLLVCPAHLRPCINGALAPLVALLRERDHVQFTPSTAVHISLLNRPRIGPPPPELLGRECPVCRRPFTTDTTCYQCACGTAFHMEERAGDLQCVQTRSECTCGRPIVLAEGFTYEPDLLHA